MKPFRIAPSLETQSDTGPNLVPFLNLFTVLVPFLLTSVVFMQIEFLHLFLPVEPSGEMAADREVPEQRPLGLIIRVDDESFTVQASNPIPSFKPIRRTHGERLVADSIAESQIKSLSDYSTLMRYLNRVKRQYPHEHEVIIVAKDHIRYPTIVAVMDCARYESRFPTISFSRWER
jgi:biopolymer transport protein ExbD